MATLVPYLLVGLGGFLGANARFILTRLVDGAIVTRYADNHILKGITRTTLFDVAARLGLRIEERAFTVEEALSAREAFLSSATTLATPIVAIDGHAVANGHPGSLTLSLRQAFFEIAEKSPA